MLDRFLTLAIHPNTEPDLRREVAGFVQSLRTSAGCGDRGQVSRTEAAVQPAPQRAFTFDAGSGQATLQTASATWPAGRFEIPSIAELRQRAACPTPGASGAEAKLWVLDGASPVTDIGSLQATAGDAALFQVASQFNCLESPGPYVTPVAAYFHDPTQGPRASISAFPATLLRHYAAPGPGGERFVQQTGGRQIDLLTDVFEPGTSPVRNGYLEGHGGMGAAILVAALEAGFERIRVGVHDTVQVVLGYNWGGAVGDPDSRRITQVFTSTVAGGGYAGQNALGENFGPACRHTLRAAYLGTLLAAVALRRTTAVLTLIGGGVFGNPIALIWKSILGAFDEVRPFAQSPLNVVLNGYNLSRLIGLERILPDVRSRGGAILRFDDAGLAEVRR
jgi:hypothetical protein